MISAKSCWRIAIGIVVWSALCSVLMAQQGGGLTSAPATLTFALDFPESNPEHYSIVVESSGHTRYESTATVAEDSEKQNYRAEFEMSGENRQKIFEWAKQAKYFGQIIDSGNGKLAFTGAKVLSYQDGQRSNTARYDYSNLTPVRQLTVLFQNIAATMEYGRRLTYYHRYQKLALDEELKRMEAQAKNNDLSEIQGVGPVLQEIYDDVSVINGVRARAKELMEMGSGATAKR